MKYENEGKEDDSYAFTGEILDVHIQAAKRYGVEPVIHPKDFMYWATVHGLPPAEAHPRSAMNYFEGGSACAHRIASIEIFLFTYLGKHEAITRPLHTRREVRLTMRCKD